MKSNRTTTKQRLQQSPVNHSLQLLDASYLLSRDQKRILYLLLADSQLVKELGVIIDIENGILEFDLKAYQTIYGVDSHEASRDVRIALEGFNKKDITFYIPDESTHTEKAIDVLTWLGKRSYRPERGRYTVYFNTYLTPYLITLKTAIGPRFKDLDQLSNPLHSRLYTKLLQKEQEQSCQIAITWMTERFKLPKSYLRYSNFKQKFLLPCVEKIRTLEGMESLRYEEIKSDKAKPRAVTEVLFKWD